MTEKWLDQEQKRKSVVNVTDYIKLSAGLVQVRQLNELIEASNLVSFINNKKKLLYYKQPLNLKYTPPEIGQEWNSYLTDDEMRKDLNTTFTELKNSKKEKVYLANRDNTKTHFLVDTYKKVTDRNGNFSGVLQESQDIYPLVEFYLKETGQKLVNDPNNNVSIPETDADTGASEEWT